MKNLIHTQTAQNLIRSLANECQTSIRYDFFAQKAKQAGYIQIANIFLETALHEKAHAETFLYFLKADFNDSMLNFNVTSPVILHDKIDGNLEGAIHLENKLWTQTYPQYAQTALKEGFNQVADVFGKIAVAEKMHDKRFSILAKNLNNDTLFGKNEELKWMCNNCGYLYLDKGAPEKCPSCAKPQGYFQVFCETR
ncbi:MAG: rubrerythrin family protein [Sporomusaceae bacterium]|jgi:rubrerythrin|nr:rubrerythrin family protein [Sporomusaceae bacterium]